MSCPERTNNTISFTIKKNSTGAVIVRFEGDGQKVVEVDWGDSGSGVSWDSCDLDTGVNYAAKLKNTGTTDYSSTVTMTYSNEPCGVAGPTMPANDGSLLVENCNPGPVHENYLVVAAWKMKAPDDNDTVEVTIVVEDDSWLGEGDR